MTDTPPAEDKCVPEQGTPFVDRLFRVTAKDSDGQTFTHMLDRTEADRLAGELVSALG